ncbi:hypothetical protein AB0O64_30330 [Streptomyces sp. NPDC088341]
MSSSATRGRPSTRIAAREAAWTVTARLHHRLTTRFAKVMT